MAIHRCPRCGKKFGNGPSVTRHLAQPNSLCARSTRSPVHSALRRESEEVDNISELEGNELDVDNIGDGQQ